MLGTLQFADAGLCPGPLCTANTCATVELFFFLKSLTDLLCKEDPNHKSVGRGGNELSEVNNEKNITEKSRMTVEIMSKFESSFP